MEVHDVRVRTMGRSDLELALSWAAAEGWNPGRHDATPFHVADPEGFLIVEAGGEPAACISVVRYSPAFAFLGLYIARPERRGQGLGLAAWRAGMARLGGCLIGLDGVIAQQANYRKSGFVLAHRNVRYAGPPPRSASPAGLIELRGVPFDRLVAYDRPLFPTQRAAFLAAWVGMPEAIGLAALRDGALAGVGMARPCREGWKVGPLFADGEDIAEALFLGLGARLPGGPIFLDVPEVNPGAVRLAERHGLVPAFETARMYTGPAPAIDLARIYGITTFELG
jgi:hypothetical protein